MPVKRVGHRKSRKGCLRCKARHVKCDEQRPCGDCVRHDVPCSLVTSDDSRPSSGSGDVLNDNTTFATAGSPVVDRRESHRNVLSRSPLSEVSSGLVPASFVEESAGVIKRPEWMQSLRLLHHYCSSAYSVLAREPETADLWRLVVPQIACSHECLMHGLLALSALHYAHAHPDQRREYAIISSAYQDLALQHFSPCLHTINEENCVAFFLLATFIVVLALATIANPQDEDKVITAKDVASMFSLMPGLQTILDFKPMERWRREGPLGVLLQQFEEPPRISPNSMFQRRMEKLSVLAREIPPRFTVINDRSACLIAIESLSSTYAITTNNEPLLSARWVWAWPNTLPQLFIDMIGNSHPLALVILAHYAALTRAFEHQSWLSQGWSTSVLHVVEHDLDPSWRDWIMWPKKCVENGHISDDMDEDTPFVAVAEPGGSEN